MQHQNKPVVGTSEKVNKTFFEQIITLLRMFKAFLTFQNFVLFINTFFCCKLISVVLLTVIPIQRRPLKSITIKFIMPCF
jgi:hypothetical protein